MKIHNYNTAIRAIGAAIAGGLWQQSVAFGTFVFFVVVAVGTE